MLRNLSLLPRKSVLGFLSLVLILLTTIKAPPSARAGGTVNNCTETDLDTALSGGGTVTFACDGTITTTGTKTISANTVLDCAGHNVVISGGNSVQLFQVNSGVTLTLLNLTLANGMTTTNGGAIYNAGTISASNCVFGRNAAAGTNGAAGNAGSGGGTFGSDGSNGKAGGSAAGGAIYNLGSLSLVRCMFQTNSAAGGGGGPGGNGGSGTTLGGAGGVGAAGGTGLGGAIYSTNSVSITNCSFVGNAAQGGNGGAGGAGGTGPTAGTQGDGGKGGEGSGAGVYDRKTSTIVGCTFNGNSAKGADSMTAGSGTFGNTGQSGGVSLGGGFANLGTNATLNCTFFANSAIGGKGGDGGTGSTQGGTGGNGGTARGAGLYNAGKTGVTNCTFSSCVITGGVAGAAGGGGSPGFAGTAGASNGADVGNNGGTFTIRNSIFAYKVGDGNLNGTFIDAGNNISSDSSVTLNGAGSLNNTDPKLDTLADNGGFTKTCALLAGSPAIGAGGDSAAPLNDQRGYFRYSTSDIGAFEYGGNGLQVVALGPVASLDGNVGLFLLAGPANGASAPITVNFAISGTASNGVDYVQVTNTAVIGTNVSYSDVLVRGIAGAFAATNKSVILTVLPGTGYQVDALSSNATVIIYDHNSFDSAKRYIRGTSTAPDFQSFVVPVDSEKGMRLDGIAGNATNLFPGNQWTNTLYHFDATNPASQNFVTNRIAFQNPIVAFGGPVGGSPLYLNQSYSFGIYAGLNSGNVSNALRIQVYYRSNSALAGTIALPLPDMTKTNQLTTFVSNGFTVTAEQFGLRSVLLAMPGGEWGTHYVGGAFLLTHTASAAATNYYYVVEDQGFGPYNYLVLNQAQAFDWSRLYAMEFSPFPSGRSIFVDEPHFDSAPLPSTYQGKTVQELTNAATLPNLSSLVYSNYLAIDGSPELRRHPILNQFVKDMGNDPLALANYVINEIDLTDAIDYDTNHNSQPSINLGGVDRSALATFQEGQGSPVEQCGLLVYFLRQAGVPAAYVYPTNGGLQMLDFQVSKLLRVQLRGALNGNGQTNLPQTISVNYPWVAAYVGGAWVQIFPWLKDTSIIEGFDLYDYMPTNYNSGYKWMSQFIANDTNIFSLSDSDQPLDLLPKFIQQNLNANYPGMSVDDLGVQIVNRRHLYAQWSDFPKPFSLSGTPAVIESLKTNLNLFNTLQIRAYSQANTNKFIDTSEMLVADLHNRKMLLKFLRVDTTNLYDMVLSLNSYSTNITSRTNFSATANPTWKLSTTNRLDSTDDNIIFQVTHRRLRFLGTNYAAPDFQVATNLWGYNYFERGEQQAGTLYQFSDTFRKGDLVTFCLDVGKVTQKMLNVHAQEIWQFNLTANTNQPSTLDPDVYQGTTAYLLGMSYYNYMDRFSDLNNRLHKIQPISSYQHGFGLIRPSRDASGNLLNDAVLLTQPAVHMPNNGQAMLFNATLRPDSGNDFDSATLGWWLQGGLQGSSAEHAVLRSFYQTNAISTVKLLQGVGTNIVRLNADNYLSAGTNKYHNVALKDADPAVWNKVLSFFDGSDYERQAWLTPGVVTNGTYVGVGALLFSFSQFTASVGGLDGGLANPFATNTFGQVNSINLILNPAPDGSPTPHQLQTGPTTGYLVDGAVQSGMLSAVDTKLQNGQAQLDPSWNVAGSQIQAQFGTPNNSSSTYDKAENSGVACTDTVWRRDLQNLVAEPVEAMTGEFYIDSTDLSLPGPMPLQVRRNYGSQNLAENEFGFGWKISYVPFLSLNTNSTLIYAAEMDGSFLAYRQTTTNAAVWLPQAQDNLTLNNNSTMGIGSVANPFSNRILLSTPGGTNVYVLTGGDGSVRTYTQRNYVVGSFNRTRPYLDKWQDSRGNYYLFQYGTDSLQPDFGEVRRIQSSNGNFLGFYYDVYGHITEAYTGDGRRLHYEYDRFGDLNTVTLPDESQVNYEYQHLNYVTNSLTNLYSTHLILQELKPDGRVLKNDYDSLRRVTNQYSTVGLDLSLVRNATFRYTNNFSLGSTNPITGTTTVLDWANNPTTYFYTNSLIRKILDPLNQAEVQDWYETDTAGGFRRSLKSRTDKRGLVTTLLYDSFGNVTNTTVGSLTNAVAGDLLGDGSITNAITSATFNSNNLPVLITDPLSNSVSIIYDTNFLFLPQQVIKLAGAVAVSTNFLFYDSITNVVSLGTNQVTNAAFGVLRKEIRAFSSIDAATNEWFRDGRGFITNAVQYTGAGTSDPNVTNQFVNNERGEMVKRTDAAGRVFRFGFDPLGRPALKETYEAGASQPMDWLYLYYNDNGEPTWSDGPRYDPEDYVWRDYDGAGRKTQEIHWRSEANTNGTAVVAAAGDNLFATRFAIFDPFGNLTNSVDELGNYSVKFYDPLGRLLREEFYDANRVLLATNGVVYNPAGDATNIFNALGGSSQRQFTSTGKPKFQKNPDGSTNAWTYYLDGRLRREIQRNGAFWETTYDDALRRVTKIFYTSATNALTTNITELDRRGNVIRTVDAGGFGSTNSFDGLDRLKWSIGPLISFPVQTNVPAPPGGAPPSVQQVSTNFYDAAGLVLTNINALGERTTIFSDALGRTTRTEIRSAANVLVRESTSVYAANHHSVTVTNGSGSGAIVSTAFTDNDGHTILSIGYPGSGTQEFTRGGYDVAGNPSFTGRYSSSNGVVTLWTQSSNTFDGLHRLHTTVDRDNALTTFSRDAAGNVTNRVMPGGLTNQAAFNNAGQILREWDVGVGAAVTRSNNYAYFSTGLFAGLLQTSADGRGVGCTHIYDDWLRPATNIYIGPLAEHNLTNSWRYDARGFVTAITEQFTNSGFAPTVIQRSNDAYGLLFSEIVFVNGSVFQSAADGWDSAGRRLQLGLGSAGFAFAWQADGLLATILGNTGNNNNYGYTTAGLLTNRTVGSRVTATTSWDGVGRPLSITTKVNTSTRLTETLGWTGDGLLNTDTQQREDFTNSQAFIYTTLTRRLAEERLNLDANKRWTNIFTFDGGSPNGPGVLTMSGMPNSTNVSWNGATDAFSRVNSETNTVSHRLAYGRVNGPSTITAAVDGQPMAVTVVGTGNTIWTNQWQSMLELTPGAHQLQVSATLPGGLFTTNASSWFTNNTAYEVTVDTFDGAGTITQRIWKSPSGATNRTQTLSWDAKGRLRKVVERDSVNNGQDWTGTFDAFGRRLQTTQIVATNGVALTNSPIVVSHYFDPLVEFLELGVTEGGRTTWKMMGPDANGVYGGMNGTGGFEAIVPGPDLFCPVVSDFRGNVLAVYDGIHSGGLVWSSNRVAGFGGVPGYRPLPAGTGGSQTSLVGETAYRNRMTESIGYVWLGRNIYDPSSGRFLSFDARGHDSSPGGYEFCGGDPVNYFDPDGRLSARNTTTGLQNPAPPLELGVAPVMQQNVYADYYFTDGSHTGPLSPSQSILYDPNSLSGNKYWSVTEPTGDYFSYVRDKRDGGALADPDYGRTTWTPITHDLVEEQQRLEFLKDLPGVLMALDGAGALAEGRVLAAESLPNSYAGIREASQYLQDMGVARADRVRILQSFEAENMAVRQAGQSEFGLRYFSNPNRAGGSYLFETFPASRESLAIKPEWSTMSGFRQFQIQPGTPILEGRAAAQGAYLPGGQMQKFILDWRSGLIPPP